MGADLPAPILFYFEICLTEFSIANDRPKISHCRRLVLTVKHSQMLSVEIGSPTSSTPSHSLINRFPTSRGTVRHILTMRTLPQIALLIIKLVSVNVVNNLSRSCLQNFTVHIMCNILAVPLITSNRIALLVDVPLPIR